ncbi:MAG: chemotaxis protein CheA [Parasphingorhabdus sp.]|uniref:chemotaxis protein CheA n=1 Tax=Parasphingorhabdus sp. TaxID=2709688 RepID=UPI0032974E7F
MDDLHTEFIAETREMLESVQEELVAWEADPANRDKLDAIFRFVHTVKGNCGFFDLPRLAELSHIAESALSDVRAGKRSPDVQLIDAIFATIDRIGEMIDIFERGEDLPESRDDDLIGALKVQDGASNEQTPSTDAAQTEHSLTTNTPIARSIRLPVTLLDRVMVGVSDLVLVRNELGRLIRDSDADTTILSTFDRLTTTIDEMREDISHMRMHRLDHLYSPLPRLVRDLSAELGKKTHLEIEGGQVELDREIIELIRDPIIHILRNAIDHGIESPADRISAGKEETGLIQIMTRQTGNRISIAIVDDGRGIDTVKLCAKAVANGIISEKETAGLSEKDILALIFEPGISTAHQVTSVSGRGVGMDVVRSNIERLGGEISVTSETGEGTRLFLSLPATLSIVPSLTVQVGDHRFGVPRSYVQEIVSSRSQELQFINAGDSKLVHYRDQKLRCSKLADILGIDAGDDGNCDLMIVKIASGDLFALAVDQVISHEELVVKPLADAIMATNLYTGASLLDDGSLVLMLHVAGIAIKENLLSDIVKKQRRPALKDQDNMVKKINVPAVLFQGLDEQPRLVRMDSVHRIVKVCRSAIRSQESSAQVVIDDHIIPLAGTSCGDLPDENVNILLLSDRTSEIAYAIDKVLDTVSIEGDILSETTDGEIEGVTLLDGNALEMLNCHWLFAHYGKPLETTKVTICRMNLDDAWGRSILKPLVEAAGYQVIGAQDKQSADIAIALDEEADRTLEATETIRLTSRADTDEKAGNEIYRYDRDALNAALKSRKRKSA